MCCIFKTISKLCLWPWLSSRHYDTLATGIIYFHRFYMFHSFKQFPRYVSSPLDVFLFFFEFLLETWLQLVCVKGDGGLLSVPGWQSGGDAKEVQRYHQDGSQSPERRAVCPVWRWPQGNALASFSFWVTTCVHDCWLLSTGMLFSTGRSDGVGEDPVADHQVWPAGGAPLHVPAALCQAA